MSWKRTLEAGLLKKCRGNLMEKLGRRTGIPEITLNYFDVSVKGSVPTPADRKDIRERLDGISGARCREKDIAELYVTPALDAVRDDAAPTHLRLTGHLSDTETLEKVAKLVRRAEPGVVLDTSGVEIDAAVLPLEPAVPRSVLDAPAHPGLDTLWRKVMVTQPKVAIDYTEAVPRLSGKVPDEKLRASVVEAITASRPDLKLDATGLTVDPVLPPVPFAAPVADTTWSAPAWLAPVWDSWNVYPALDVTVEKGTVTLSGVISNATLRDTVVTLLRRSRPDLFFGPPKNLTIKNGSLDKPLVIKRSEDFIPPPWLAPAWQKVLNAPPPPPSR